MTLVLEMMDIAKDILIRYCSLFDNLPMKGDGNLRFGHSLLRISDIASQYYCEKKLEIRHEHPLPPTQRMIDGEAGHEAVTSLAEPLTKEQAIEAAIEESELPICLYEFNLGWKYKDVPIIGKVDEAWFRGGTVDLVVERKFSDSLKVYNPYHIQAQLYCMGLGEMGFENSNTKYRIMVFKRSCHDCEKLIDRSCPIFELGRAQFQCDTGIARAYLYAFDESIITRDLDWALEYWLCQRDAVPTQNQAKCKACEYNEICNR
jgi:CRISPR/Cas system-associated exonuclease Cas4 (RecB family)